MPCFTRKKLTSKASIKRDDIHGNQNFSQVLTLGETSQAKLLFTDHLEYVGFKEINNKKYVVLKPYPSKWFVDVVRTDDSDGMHIQIRTHVDGVDHYMVPGSRKGVLQLVPNKAHVVTADEFENRTFIYFQDVASARTVIQHKGTRRYVKFDEASAGQLGLNRLVLTSRNNKDNASMLREASYVEIEVYTYP